MAEEKKGFFQKIKDFFRRLKEENRNLATTTKRINSQELCGAVNRGVKNGDFWEGSYISVTMDGAVIYGSAQDDYNIPAGSVKSIEKKGESKVSVGDKTYPANKYEMKLEDGKVAYVDLMTAKEGAFRAALKL